MTYIITVDSTYRKNQIIRRYIIFH